MLAGRLQGTVVWAPPSESMLPKGVKPLVEAAGVARPVLTSAQPGSLAVIGPQNPAACLTSHLTWWGGRPLHVPCPHLGTAGRFVGAVGALFQFFFPLAASASPPPHRSCLIPAAPCINCNYWPPAGRPTTAPQQLTVSWPLVAAGPAVFLARVAGAQRPRSGQNDGERGPRCTAEYCCASVLKI